MATAFPPFCPPSTPTSILLSPSIHSSISIQKTAGLLWIIYKNLAYQLANLILFDFYQNLIFISSFPLKIIAKIYLNK